MKKTSPHKKSMSAGRTCLCTEARLYPVHSDIMDIMVQTEFKTTVPFSMTSERESGVIRGTVSRF